MNLEQLRARVVELVAQAQAIRDTAGNAKRDFTKEEAESLDGVMAEFDACVESIDRLERVARMEGQASTSAGRTAASGEPGAGAPAGTGAVAGAAQAAGGTGTPPAKQQRRGMEYTALSDPSARARWGWPTFGDFAAAVRSASTPNAAMDPRLVQAASLSTYSTEGVGGDGGFAVPPEWRSTIMELVIGESSLLSMTDQQPASGNTITYPVDETTPHQSTGGIQAYWDSEAAAITQSKLALKDLTIKLSRLTALVPVTEELLEDTAALGAYISKKAGEKMQFKVNDAIINGTGVGQPLGIMNAPCLVTVSKESSQTADTFHANNVANMIARMPANSYGRSTWMINQDLIPQIMKMGFVVTDPAGTTAGGAGAIWLPPNGLQNSSTFGSLAGRPIFVTEACSAIGDLGDVILGDLTQYLSVIKSGGLKSDVSMHLWFDQNVSAFRFVLRMNGQPWLSAAIARKNGTKTLSHFVTLEAR